MTYTLAQDTELLCESIVNGKIPRKVLDEAIIELVRANPLVAQGLVSKLIMDRADEYVFSSDSEGTGSDSQSDTSSSGAKATSTTNATQAPTLKRKAEDEALQLPRRILAWKTCKNCGDTYNINFSDACEYHDGEREVDWESDVWADHDPVCHGPPDAHEEDMPEGFVWTCCDAGGDDVSGCVKSAHEPI